MTRISRRTALTTLIAGGATALGLAAFAQPRMRVHTAIETKSLSLLGANSRAGGNQVTIRTSGARRIITANGIPDHKVGAYPNRGNPNRLSAQSYRFEMPLDPHRSATSAEAGGILFGVGLNGVPFDPGAAEFWQGQRNSGWQYEALGGAVALGLDANYAHVQPTGAYHYHGLPIGLMQNVGWTGGKASPLIGYAADGYPIYALMAEIGGRVVEMTSSYRLKSGNRPGGRGPDGRYDGTFVQDYLYVAGAGRLDECNGAVVKTAEYPQGTYAYFLSQTFPVIPRRIHGAPDNSFGKRR